MIESLSFVAGAVTGWLTNWYFYVRARKENAPGLQLLVQIQRRLGSKSTTTDQAAREIIDALDSGALSPAAIQHYEWEYRFCPEPECGGQVELVGSWSADDYGAFGGMMKCKRCSWKKEFAY
jgi:hypothetical protein